MTTQTILRPAVAELSFRIFGRPLHPELFDVLAERRILHPDFQLCVRVTPTGHVLSWDNGAVHLSEATVGPFQELPPSRRLAAQPFGHEASMKLDCGKGVHYQATWQTEAMPPEAFVAFHDEILADGGKRGLLFNFGGAARLALAPLAHLTAEFRPGCLFLTAFHTFPREFAVLKTQSLIEQRR